MSQLTITGHSVTLLAVAQSNADTLLAKIQELDGQRKQILAAIEAEIKEAAAAQGVELPAGANAIFQGDKLVVSWQDDAE